MRSERGTTAYSGDFSVRILGRTAIPKPEAASYQGACESLIFPTLKGQYGVLPHHRNMIAAVIPGTLRYKLPGQEERIAAVSEGMIKIEDNEVLILVDSAERPEDIDANRAKRAADAAKEAMLQKRSMQEYHVAEANLARAINRLKVKNHNRDLTRK